MTTSTLTITEFLLARIAEDEHEAEQAKGLPKGMRFWSDNPGGAFDPDHVLAECEAKRRIVDEHPRCNVHDRPGDECDACLRCGDGSIWPCDTLLAIASVYAGHPDFREEWRI